MFFVGGAQALKAPKTFSDLLFFFRCADVFAWLFILGLLISPSAPEPRRLELFKLIIPHFSLKALIILPMLDQTCRF